MTGVLKFTVKCYLEMDVSQRDGKRLIDQIIDGIQHRTGTPLLAEVKLVNDLSDYDN